MILGLILLLASFSSAQECIVPWTNFSFATPNCVEEMPGICGQTQQISPQMARAVPRKCSVSARVSLINCTGLLYLDQYGIAYTADARGFLSVPPTGLIKAVNFPYNVFSNVGDCTALGSNACYMLWVTYPQFVGSVTAYSLTDASIYFTIILPTTNTNPYLLEVLGPVAGSSSNTLCVINTGNASFTLFNGVTGTYINSITLPNNDGTPWASQIVSVGNINFLIISTAAALYSFNIATAHPAWKVSYPYPTTSNLGGVNNLFFVAKSGQIYLQLPTQAFAWDDVNPQERVLMAVDAVTGATLWRSANSTCTLRAITSNCTLLCQEEYGSFIAMQASATALGPPGPAFLTDGLYSLSFVDSGNVAVFTNGNNMMAFDLNAMAPIWSVNFTSSPGNTPFVQAAVGGGQLVVLASAGYHAPSSLYFITSSGSGVPCGPTLPT
jgi:hypothetical protein